MPLGDAGHRREPDPGTRALPAEATKREEDLEVAESAVIRQPEQALRVLSASSGLGVRLAMDDFGTGYSSLAHLHRLPFDTVKIDRAFVNDLGDPRCAAITRAIIALAKQIDLETVAEGFETFAQRDLLADEGCRLLQGYLFGKPSSESELLRLARLSRAAVPVPS